MATTDPNVIQQLVAPAVMISASGLLLLSSSARMNTVLARIRVFHAERLALWRGTPEAGSRPDRVRTLQLEDLHRQTRRLLHRAGLLRATMLQLFGAVGCHLVSIVALAGGVLAGDAAWLGHLAVWVFLVGIGLTLTAMATSAAEVLAILEAVRYEHRRVDELCRSEVTEGAAEVTPDPRTGEGTGL